MKTLLFLLFLLIVCSSFAQRDEIIALAFKDKSNFDITTALDNEKPSVYYVLNKTDEWYTYRFHVDEDLTSENVIKELERDEHSPYNNSYIFKNKSLDSLFKESEKKHLYKVAKSLKPKKLGKVFKEFKQIKGFKAAKNGFFFSVTEPIFTADKQYSFIDVVVHKKDKNTEDFDNSYFGMCLLIYHFEGKKWTKVQLIERLIL